jgi:putative Holliday junction resolvase
MGRAMGLDVGTKTIGVAISDPLRIAAHPDRTVARKGVKSDVAALMLIVAEKSVDYVVVGLPFELSGEELRSARLARQIGDGLGEASGLPVTYVDERFTTVEAERRMRENGTKAKKRRETIDQVAAALILQSFLDHGDFTRANEPGAGE